LTKCCVNEAMIDVLEFFNRVDQLNVTEEDTNRFLKLSSQKKKYESIQIKIKTKKFNGLLSKQSIVNDTKNSMKHPKTKQIMPS
jgi:uncharacterized protein YktA (UPF0223 family)